MSLYRCVFCGGKSDDSDDFREASKKEIKDSKTVIEGSDYEWLVCNDCSKERQN